MLSMLWFFFSPRRPGPIFDRICNAVPMPWQVSVPCQSNVMNPRPWHLPAVWNSLADRSHRDVRTLCLRNALLQYKGVYESWCSDSGPVSSPVLLPLLILGICTHSMYTSLSYLFPPTPVAYLSSAMSFGGRWAAYYKEKVYQFLLL
jgi:hypothetical protein